MKPSVLIPPRSLLCTHDIVQCCEFVHFYMALCYRAINIIIMKNYKETHVRTIPGQQDRRRQEVRHDPGRDLSHTLVYTVMHTCCVTGTDKKMEQRFD